ncbi:MAG: DUF72 domain-containing protein [Planctomycetes bacterium]|nr:DUF72 domain-containing protein [Planctomycetota bacterium]
MPPKATSGAFAAAHTEQSSNAELWIGTSGYSYPEWIAAGVYPEGLSTARMLRHYASKFSTVELNYTWYQLPKADAVERQRREAPDGFLFAAKLTRTLTHQVDGGWKAQAAQYRDGIAPLAQSRQLAAVLAQFPPEFSRSAANRKHLAALLDALEGLPVAVEFRHASWNHERVFRELARRRVTLAAVDEPDLPGLFPPLARVTDARLFYARFHGRNAKGWGSGRMERKFDYSYSDAELSEWIVRYLEPMAQAALRGVIFFNNHVRGQAVKNAWTLRRLLRARGWEAR